MYLRNHGVRGRHKIQDIWSSVVHQVVRAPTGEGVVYTVAPVDDPDRTRNVHRDMLKAVVQPEAVAAPPPASPSLPPLTLLVSETPAPPTAVLPPSASPQAFSALAGTQPQAASSLTAPVDGKDPSQPAPLLLPADQLSSSQQPLRQTTRSTAGSHPNVHHLPRPAGSQGNAAIRPLDSTSNSQTVVFRPWC